MSEFRCLYTLIGMGNETSNFFKDTFIVVYILVSDLVAEFQSSDHLKGGYTYR